MEIAICFKHQSQMFKSRRWQVCWQFKTVFDAEKLPFAAAVRTLENNPSIFRKG